MTSIDFGVWDHVERRPGVEPQQEFREKIAFAQEAERLGLYGYQLAEHHLSPLSIAPSPNLLLAAMAHATSRIRLGSMVHILPYYHPVRLVQEICMLDQLSGGRLDLGVGPGVRRASNHGWFGLYNMDDARPLFEETLDIITSGLTNGNLAHNGRFYRIDNAPLDLLPVQKPYPPLWYAGVEYAARRNLSFFSRTNSDVPLYWQLWDEASQSNDRLNPTLAAPKVGITKHLVVRETDAEAMKIAHRAWPVFSRDWQAGPDSNFAAAGPGTGRAEFDEVYAADRRLLIGSPATVRSYLEGVIDEVKDRPTFYFAGEFQWGDIDQEEALETLQLFASEVMPALRPVPAG